MLEDLSYLTEVAELRPLYAQPSALVRAKQLDRLDAHCCRFIEKSPLVIIGSSDPGQGHDVSPRGDAPGFVQILDPQHLAIPDRPGNNASIRSRTSSPMHRSVSCSSFPASTSCCA